MRYLILGGFFGLIAAFFLLSGMSVVLSVSSMITGVFVFWPTLAVTVAAGVCGVVLLRILR